MPVARLNNISLQAGYTDALTVQFPFPRGSFNVQVYGNSAFYQVGVIGPAGRDIVWQSDEGFTAPAMLSFDSPSGEGFSPGSMYAGIRLRRGSATNPITSVTVS